MIEYLQGFYDFSFRDAVLSMLRSTDIPTIQAMAGNVGRSFQFYVLLHLMLIIAAALFAEFQAIL